MIDVAALLLTLAVFAFGVYATSHTSFGRGRLGSIPFWVQFLLEVPLSIFLCVALATIVLVIQPLAHLGDGGRAIRITNRSALFELVCHRRTVFYGASFQCGLKTLLASSRSAVGWIRSISGP